MNVLNLLNRQLNLLDYALSSLHRKRLKNTGILLVFSAVIFLFSSVQLMTRGLGETAEAVLKNAPDITVQQLSAGRQVDLDISAIDSLSSVFGISGINDRIWGYYFDESNGANYTVVGLRMDQLPENMLPMLEEGRRPESSGKGEVIISDSVRESMGLGSRRNFSLFRPDLSMMSFSVSGSFSEDTSIVTADTMLMPLEDARELFGMQPTKVTDLLVNVGNPREIDTIAAKIADKIPGSRVITRDQILKTYSVVFSWRSGFGSVCLLAVLAAFVILAYDKASGLTREDQREVGILKILGWRTTDVMAVRFWESGIVSLMALALGYSFSWVHVVWGSGILFEPLLLGWSVLKPQISFVPSFSLNELLLIFSVTVLPYLCATVIPAWRSAVIRPDSVV